MTESLQKLYQRVILDHYKKPRNFEEPASFHRRSVGDNPLCGDQVTLYLSLDGERIEQATFQGHGCAICIASASMLTEAITGESVEHAQALFETFQQLVSPDAGELNPSVDLGDLKLFEGVRAYRTRIKCATLPWFALRAALNNQQETISTE